jgi:hypothetical protein
LLSFGAPPEEAGFVKWLNRTAKCRLSDAAD